MVGALLGAGVLAFLLFIRFKDLPKPAPVSPFRHLDERKAAIYESLRDLQFEYRLNKLSDEDYQTTKVELQKELARVLAETDKIKAGMGQGVKPEPAAAPAVEKPKPNTCPSCGAAFEKALKFCGECGKPMAVSK
ncbi:MAG: hypothetical protein KGN84_08765 [Acidobacteriota bacterium]|nr:hypothetical protein [Acidobacteriota bacterium]